MVVILAVVGGLLFFLLRIPPQRQHGVLQPFPLLATGVLAVSVILGASLIALGRMEGRPLGTLGLPSTGNLPAVSLGLGFGMIVPIVVTAGIWASGHATISPAQLTGSLLLSATLPMIGATLLLSSWEEMAFRGYPLQLLSQLGGPWVGALITGLLFGLAHGGNPGANLLGFLNTALNGALLAGVVMRTGSLWLACGYHAGWNLAAANLLGLTDSGTVAPGALLSTTLTGPAWLSGGEYGFEASLLTGVAETLLLGAMLLQAHRLPATPEAKAYYSTPLSASGSPLA